VLSSVRKETYRLGVVDIAYTLRRWGQENFEFEASPGYIVKPCLNCRKQEKRIEKREEKKFVRLSMHSLARMSE
jgi:hypothetical protein